METETREGEMPPLSSRRSRSRSIPASARASAAAAAAKAEARLANRGRVFEHERGFCCHSCHQLGAQGLLENSASLTGAAMRQGSWARAWRCSCILLLSRKKRQNVDEREEIVFSIDGKERTNSVPHLQLTGGMSSSVRLRTPVRHARSARQVSRAPRAERGVTRPIPVTTTLRRIFSRLFFLLELLL
jgi:hypothetical protein